MWTFQPFKKFTRTSHQKFYFKKSIIYGLLTKTFEKNHKGFAHIGAVAIGDGLTAWKIFAAMIIESSGDAKTDFST